MCHELYTAVVTSLNTGQLEGRRREAAILVESLIAFLTQQQMEELQQLGVNRPLVRQSATSSSIDAVDTVLSYYQ
jgi:hypothetical protein